MTPDELRQQIELKVVELIKKQLADGAMTDERAQAISQHVLSTLQPGMSLEELYQAIPKLDDSFQELAPVVLPMLKQYEEDVNQKAMVQIRELIKQGHYDAAAKLGKQAVNQEIKLTWTGGADSKHTQ